MKAAKATLLLCAACAFGCTPKAKEEAALLVAAVDSFRHVPEDKKVEALGTLGSVGCSVAEICDAKTVCFEYAQKTVASTQITVDVRAKLADVTSGKMKADDPVALDLYAQLDRSEKLLREAEAALLKCDEKMQRFKRGR